MHKHDGQQYLPISLDADAAFHLTSVHGLDLNEGAAAVHNRLHALEQDRAIELDEVTRLREQLAAAQRDLQSERLTRAAAERNLDTFKAEVRDRVIEGKDKYDLCDDGTSWFLDSLGLPGIKRDYVVKVPATLSFNVEAASEADAISEVRGAYYGASDADDVDFDWYEAEAEEV